MFTSAARPRILLSLAATLVAAAVAFLLWQMRLPLRRASVEMANRYLPNRVDLQVKPGANAEAYALYLRARELETHTSRPDLIAARDLYAQAVAAEPRFAQAHARYSNVLSELNEAKNAYSEAEEALRLDPELGEGHFARAIWLMWDERYADAVPEMEIAARALPTDSEIIYQAASLHRRLGRWKDSLAEFQKAVALDPRYFNGPTDLAYHLSLMRDWPAATAAWDRALAIVPEFMFNKICRAYVDFWARGDLGRGNALLASFPSNYGGAFSEFLAWMRWDFSLLQHNYEAADQAIGNIKEDPVSGGFLGPITRSYMRGCIELARDNPKAATPLFAESCPFFEERVRKFANRATGHARLAMVYAFMGRKDDALREASRASELCPETKDAFDGACISTGLAVVYARIGETDKAIAQIERLLRTPGALNYDCSITLNDLKYRWQWDPLRSDPRFQRILAGPEPKTVIP